jgi:predicted N-formylglutamate amidohydrolase
MGAGLARPTQILQVYVAVALLAGDEPAVFETLCEDGGSPFLLTCDHAGRRIPRALGTLGLTEGDLRRHIAWDIGAAGVTRFLAEELDAFAILQTYSRLVIDCNRPPQAHDLIPTVSEHTEIDGNRALSPAARKMRLDTIFTPYHERIGRELDLRQRNAKPTVLVAVHSFTPVFKGVPRPWHAGILYNRDARLARHMMTMLESRGDLMVGDNEPYAVSDATDYTIPVHGERRGLVHVEIEVRQDLIADEHGQRAWAKRLAEACRAFDVASCLPPALKHSQEN